MRRRAVLTGVLAWVLVVAVASGVTWAVIESAGQNLLAADPVVETPAAPAGPAASESTDVASPSAVPSKHRAHRTSPTARPTSAVASATSAASRTPTTPAAPPPTSGGTAPDRGVERTWQGPPGLVTVGCDGARITLRSATPSNGYRVEVDRGSQRIEVHFQSTSREYQVVARCSGGVPGFAVEGGGENDHDE